MVNLVPLAPTPRPGLRAPLPKEARKLRQHTRTRTRTRTQGGQGHRQGRGSWWRGMRWPPKRGHGLSASRPRCGVACRLLQVCCECPELMHVKASLHMAMTRRWLQERLRGAATRAGSAGGGRRAAAQRAAAVKSRVGAAREATAKERVDVVRKHAKREAQGKGRVAKHAHGRATPLGKEGRKVVGREAARNKEIAELQTAEAREKREVCRVSLCACACVLSYARGLTYTRKPPHTD